MNNNNYHSLGITSNARTRLFSIGLALVISLGPSRAEAPVDKWSNPVLAVGDAVLGPLSEAAKLVSSIYFDYSKLTASTTIQYFSSTEISTRGTKPDESYQKTIIESGVDPRNGTTLFDRKTITTVDQTGRVSVTTDTTPNLITRIGSVNTKCEARSANGSLISRFEFFVEPTKINVHVDVSKFSTFGIKNPARVYVQLSAAADVLTDCNTRNARQDWFQLATVTPGVQRIVTFEGQNQMVTAWPGIQIGYKQPTK